CGLGDKAVGVKEFVKACAGQDIVVPAPGQSVVIDSWQVTEKELNAMCANAVLMQVCIKVTESKYKSLKCPHLMELRPCKKGSLALEIVGNPDLESVELPPNVMLNEIDVEWGKRPSTPANIIVVKRNPQLQPTFVDILLQICPRCNIKDHFSRCANLDAFESVDEFASECAGQPIITAKPGVKLEFNITDTELSSLFPDVVEVHMCLNVVRTSLKELVFPKLERVPALTVTTNPELEKLRFPQCATKDCIDSAVVGRNPYLSKNELDAIENVCKNCVLSIELPCKPAIDFQENAYLRRIRFPACRSANCIDNGYIKNNPDVPDAQLRDVQAVCEKCVIEKYVPGHVLKQKLVFSACGLGNKKYTALEFVRACAGKEMIKPANNYFVVIDATEISEKEMNAMCANAVYLEACIVISATNYKSLRCPHLKEVRPCKPECSNMDSFTSVKQFLEKCSGELEISFTRPIYINLTDVSDDQINRLFANVVQLQMCLVLEQTRITKLSFPKLVRWATCGQGECQTRLPGSHPQEERTPD
ncbi:unnamed protein product, partial [Nippostrongylus brasiliensis]|uniref:AAA domain-containing protein n=1 Tax=Nippostrongylus brasiliensis TaxID=27835 RepID=A0A0N4YUH7_NIPBR